MLIIGDKDQRLLDHIYMFDGLRRLGRDVTLVRYPGEGHGMASKSALSDYWNRVNEFIDKHLKPDMSLQSKTLGSHSVLGTTCPGGHR